LNGFFHSSPEGGEIVKKAIGILFCSLCAVVFLALIIAPHPKIQHQGSSAFDAALDAAVAKLEHGGTVILNRSATPAAAVPLQITSDNGYTCDANTCDTYEAQYATCDRIDPICRGNGHTFEPPPFNHTCEGYTCDGAHTCDVTADPRAETCDAANIDCTAPTFNNVVLTCNPMQQECRRNNPKGFCTAVNYPTCDGQSFTCNGVTGCTNPTEHTSWGKIKSKFEE
jgi:hypothetical protein